MRTLFTIILILAIFYGALYVVEIGVAGLMDEEPEQRALCLTLDGKFLNITFAGDDYLIDLSQVHIYLSDNIKSVSEMVQNTWFEWFGTFFQE